MILYCEELDEMIILISFGSDGERIMEYYGFDNSFDFKMEDLINYTWVYIGVL